MDSQGIFTALGVSPKRYKDFLDATYGEEWAAWDGDALWRTLELDALGIPTDIVRDKLRALQVCRVSNKPYTDWHVFEKCVLAFSEVPVDTDMLQMAEPEEIAVAMKVIQEMFPGCEFGREIRAYIASVCAHEGFVVLPKPLDIAQDDLDRLNRGTLAEGAKAAVIKEIAKGEFPKDDDTIVGHAVSKYLAVLALANREKIK